MTAPFRNGILISTVLLVYTILLVIPLYHLGAGWSPAAQGALINPLWGAVVLFAIVVYIVVRLAGEQRRSRVAELEQQLATLRETSSEMAQGYHQNMEKKLFEIGVINASLNREIAERMQAETESRELHKQMELILNSAGEGIFGLDLDGRVTFVNTAAALMTGWRREEMMGRSHHELVHHSHLDGSPHPPEQCLISQACRDGLVHSSSEDVFWTREGGSFPVEYVSTPIIDDGRLCGAVVMFRDRSTFI